MRMPLVVASLIGVSALAWPAPAPNLAPNPGFELEDAGAPAFWEQRTPTDAARTLTWDAAVSRSGSRSLKIANRESTTSRWRTGHLRDLVLEPGTACTLSAWIKTDRVDGSAHLRLYCIRAEGGIASQPGSSSVTGTREWTHVRLCHLVPKDAAYVMPYAEIRGTGTARFDDVQLFGKPGARHVTVKLPHQSYRAHDFEIVKGFRYGRRLRKSVIELTPEAAEGRARLIFWGHTARYDVTVTHVDESDGAAQIRLLVNGRQAAQLRLDRNPAGSPKESVLAERVVHNVDVQRLSRIVVEGRSNAGEFCRVHALVFTPTGRFQGALMSSEQLRLPPSLLVYENPQERRRWQDVLGRRGRLALAAKRKARNEELDRLKTPADWRARQQRTRARLPEFFGEYGPKCPLNARIVGKLDRPGYTIEKLIFESQPGYHCTANVYVPKERPFPQPGVIFTCGHAAAGKAARLYHECCLGLVLKGYVVLALDPTGQGERSEYFAPDTLKDLVPRTVAQHHCLARPSWLVGRCLSGYRTWDCIRAVDYLASRPEVDPNRIAAVGNSGGGQMALLITAADERVAVCAAAHPGGSQENTYLRGQGLIDRDVLSLIPPRPCVFIVGRDSGEEGGHRAKLTDMQRFYRGLGVDEQRGAFMLVDGVHNMKRPKREAAYAWLNRWFDREKEQAEEPQLQPETVETLHCTETGYVLKSIGGESGQTLNARVAERIRPPRVCPQDVADLRRMLAEVKEAVRRRIGLALPADRPTPAAIDRGAFEHEDFRARKLAYLPEPGIQLPALLIEPKRPAPDSPVIVHVSQSGKPTQAAQPSLALSLARHGYTVFSIDARGAGETDPRRGHDLRPATHYDQTQWRVDSMAISCVYADTTALALRAFDVVRAVDYVCAQDALSGRSVALVGEELGGLWALVAAAFDSRPLAVACIGMAPSYKLIVGSPYYRLRDCFWVPGALEDYDVPDLPALIAPRPVALIDCVDAMKEPIGRDACRSQCEWPAKVYSKLGAPGRFRVIRTDGHESPSVEKQAEAVVKALQSAMRLTPQ